MKLTAFLFMLVTMLAALLLVIRTFDGNPERLEPAVDKEGLEQPLRRFHQPSRLTRKDLLPLLGLTAVCAVLAFLNLGDRAAVTSWHTFGGDRAAAVLTLPEETEVERLQYFGGPTVGTWRLEWTADGTTWLGRERVEQTYVDVLKWAEFRPAEGFGKLKAIRITALSDDLIMGEAALRDPSGNLIAFRTETSALGDEQSLVPAEESWRNSSYFDEIYHARTAWEHLTNRKPYEITHPPLGKEIIGLGIRIFGMTPFGWRFSGALFGVLLVPLLYILLKLMLGSTAAAACAALVYASDFMRFAQSRISTIDTYGVFFTLLMYLFFYFYYTQPWDAPLRRTLLPLGLSGLSFALGVASKWTCVFGGAGLAVLWCLRQGERLRRRGLRAELTGYLLPTVGWSCVFFIGFPLLAYFLCYLPYGRAAGVGFGTKEYLKVILDNVNYMYTYHSGLDATHPYASPWWQWVLDVRPILYYLHWFDEEYALRAAIGAGGNPLFWWTGLGAMVCMAVKGIRGDRMAWFILAGYLSTLLPWVAVERCAFIYHYFPCTLFLALAIGRCLRDSARRRLSRRDWTGPMLAGGCVFLFAVFYPALSGGVYTSDYSAALLRWFGGMWPYWIKINEKGDQTMIAIGSDHGGFALKEEIKKHLTEKGIPFRDFGTDSEASCDYPVYAEKVSCAVTGGEAEKGILCCGTGIGMSMAANKVKGIRCACCGDCFSAEMTRRHNDANVLALGGRVLGVGLALKIVDIFLETPFEGGRHARRVSQVMALEE